MILLPINKISAIVCFFALCDAYNILCFLPYPGKSHHMVFEPLLDELTDRGHNLTVVSFFPTTTPRENRRDISLVGLASLNVEVVDLSEIEYSFFGLEKYFEQIPPITGLATMNLALCEKLLDSEMFSEFIRAEGQYDVILVEHFNSDCMLGLIHNYGLSSVGLISSTLLPWTLDRVGAPDNPSYVPGMTLHLTDDMTLSERVLNTFYLYFYKLWYRFAIRAEEQRLVERKIGKSLPALEEIARNTSLILVNSHYSLNGVRAMPPSIVEIGGIHLYKRQVHPLPKDLHKLMSDAKHGVILFSFGSLIRGSTLPIQRIKIFLKVFSKLPQRIIWKWEGDALKDLPPNVVMTKWLPQYDILNHPNCVAFITHGGLLSMTEAIDAGIPMLVTPLLGDQFGNAAHAVRAGVAVSLRLQDLDETLLHEGLQTVLSFKLRDRAKVLREEWLDRPDNPMKTAVYWVERVARYKNCSLSSSSRHLPLYQTLLLDVIIVYSVILVLILLIAFTTISCLIKCVCMKKKEKLS